ncbi:hypothetical protein F4810DRAFT_283600 [Camillea tinctor]|nr:hypothetical protein F4810DRAFT_283600 [Camillea tinctor]
MMPREGRRRRSPESSRRRRKERRNSREAELQSQQIPIHTATYHGLEQAEPLPALSRVPSTPNSTTSSDSSSSSTSSSLVNISQPLQRFGFGSFFSSGGNQQREHRAKKKKKRSRFLRFGNSSSSSLGSDLAYGKGYIDRRRSSREFSPPSKQKRRRPSPPKRSGTDEEIIELGRKFAELARQQQVEDLKASGKNRSSPAASSSRRSNNGRHARGIGSSRTHRESSPDDSEWESASEDESPSEDSDSGLAYGSVPSSIEKRVHVRSPARPSAEPIHNAPIRHKRSLVDPKLFGPVNSLHGYVNAPCGFETVDRDAVTSPRQHYEASIAPSETLPLQQLYPVPTSDPSQFDVDRGSVVSAQHDYTHRSQARSVPLQQPKPIVPVSTKVFETVETDPEYSRRSSAGDTLAKAAMADIAGAALSAALNAERKNEGSRYEERRDRDEKQSQPSSTRDYDEREEKRKTRDQLRENRRETLRERDIEVERTYVKETYHQERSSTEVDRENEKERRRRDKYRGDNDPNRDHVRSTVDRKDDQQRAQQGDRKERREEHSQEQGSASRSSNETISKHSVEPEHRSSADLIDPFQYQVADDAFPTPLHTTPKRSPTPNIVTVEREPDFSDLKFSHDPPRERPRERMSRKDSYELELQKSRDITVEQSPAPVNEVAPAEPAATLTTDDRRGRRRGRGGDSSSRHRSHHSQSPPRSRDRVQDDADRIWREEMLARRIRDESRRSRSNSPDSSVVDKWTEAVTEKRKEAGDSQGFEIVSPPETDSSKKQTSPYDAPNADVHVDNIFQHPNQLPFFQPPDSSVERERLVLNIIRPTPVPTPRSEGRNPQDYIEAEKSSETREQTKVEVSETAIDVALGPQGEVVSDEPTPAPVSAPRQVLESELASEQTHKQTHQQALIPSLESIVEEALEPEPAPAQVQVPVSAPASIHEPEPGTASKVVSWGENQTKRYSVDSPERGDDTLSGEKVTPAPETPKPRSVKKSSPWRTLANVVSIGGAGAAASVTKTNVDTDMTRHIKSEDREELPRSRSSLQYDTDESPPVPGPKPTNPRSAQMPGAFAEDPYFTATIAAGMEGSGFDPNLVINDPKFHTRDSAPGSNKSAEPPVTTETPEVVQEPEPVVNDPPKAPAEKNGLSIHNSAVLLKLVQKLKRKQQAKTKEKKNGTDKVTGIESSSAVQTDASRSSIEDNASISSAKLRKEIYERGDSNLKSEIRRDSKVAEDVPSKQKLPSELQKRIA